MNNELYAQMAKNTVDSKNQLKESKLVRFHNLGSDGIRVTFVGNSITLHGAAPAIGWQIECGMAASAPENDYVHLLEGKVLEEDPRASFCICQVAEWERDYKQGYEKHSLFEAARNFDADVIILRFIENCPGEGFDGDLFRLPRHPVSHPRLPQRWGDPRGHGAGALLHRFPRI